MILRVTTKAKAERNYLAGSEIIWRELLLRYVQRFLTFNIDSNNFFQITVDDTLNI